MSQNCNKGDYTVHGSSRDLAPRVSIRYAEADGGISDASKFAGPKNDAAEKQILRRELAVCRNQLKVYSTAIEVICGNLMDFCDEGEADWNKAIAASAKAAEEIKKLRAELNSACDGE